MEETTAVKPGRSSGRHFGELVHACLEVVPLDADSAQVERVVATLGRTLRASSQELSDAKEAVVAALAHPRFVDARRAACVRREAAMVDFLDNGTAVEGVVDMAYELDGVWQVVEFKTDAAQTLAYVRAIERATQKPATGVVLRC